jgi:hypothetical protein
MDTSVTVEILFRERVLMEGAAEDPRVFVAPYGFMLASHI